MLYAWKEQADKLSSEEISKDKYDEWRYHYPEFDTTQTWAKIPLQALSDALVEMFQDKLKPDKNVLPILSTDCVDLCQYYSFI